MFSPEERDYQAAMQWALGGNHQDGDRHTAGSDYVWRGGQLMCEGEGARQEPDGRIEPYPVWTPAANCDSEGARVR